MRPGLPRGLVTALGFLTRLPLRRAPAVTQQQLSAAAAWFPLVGAGIGLVVAILHASTSIDPALAAVITVVAWIGISGGLHLDGAADLADALGARHAHPDRFFEVLRDPHVGTFGVLALVCIILLKVASLLALARVPGLHPALILIPAWTRYGAVVWSQTLPPLTEGAGERFGAVPKPLMTCAWGVALTTASLLLAPIALFAALAVAAWWIFLRARVGGMSGDALGAGIEWSEAGALLAMAIADSVRSSI